MPDPESPERAALRELMGASREMWPYFGCPCPREEYDAINRRYYQALARAEALLREVPSDA